MAGRPKGSLAPHTVIRKRAEQALKVRIARNARRIVNAQLSVALGVQVLMRKPADGGKASIVSDQDVVLRYLDGELADDSAAHYYLTLEKPDALIGDKMLDRAFGKAAQPVAGVDGEGRMVPAVVDRLFGTVEEWRAATQRPSNQDSDQTTH